MAVAFFLIVIIIYDLDLAALYPGPRWRARVAGMALSRVTPLPPVPSHTPLWYPFPLPPRPPQQQSSLFLPTLRLRVATRSPCLLRLRATPEAGMTGERKGQRDWRAPSGNLLQSTTGLYLSDSFSPVSSFSDTSPHPTPPFFFL